MKPTPAKKSGADRQHAHDGSAPEEAELHVRLAKQLDGRTKYGVLHREGADDQAGAP